MGSTLAPISGWTHSILLPTRVGPYLTGTFSACEGVVQSGQNGSLEGLSDCYLGVLSVACITNTLWHEYICADATAAGLA